MPDSSSQSIEDNGLIESIAESASRRLLAAFKSEGLIFSVNSDCNAADAMPGTAVHLWMVSARFSEEWIFDIAREKCTMLKPRATESAQIPINVIAVQKRISARMRWMGTAGPFA